MGADDRSNNKWLDRHWIIVRRQWVRIIVVAILTAVVSFRVLNWAPLVNIIWMNAAAIASNSHGLIFWIAISEAVIIMWIFWKFFWHLFGILLRFIVLIK